MRIVPRIYNASAMREPRLHDFANFMIDFHRTSLRLLLFVFCMAASSHTLVAGAKGLDTRRDLRVGVALEPPHLDPTAGAAAAIDEIVYANLFEGLTRIDAKGKVQPALAERWTRTKDGKQFVFYLRKNARFHDGNSLEAKTVAFSLTRATTPNSRNAQKHLFSNILSVEALTRHRVRVTLRTGDLSFPSKMAWGDAVIVHPASAPDNRTNPIGTGPFRFKSWRRGASLQLEKNPSYWGKSPFLENILFRFLSEPLSAQAALLAQEIDVFPNFPAPELLSTLANDKRFAVESGTTEGETLLALNLRQPFFQDLRVRQAIAHGIDRDSIVAGAMFDTARLIGSHYPPHATDYVDLSRGYAYDPARARALLREAGWGAKEIPKLTLKLPPPSYARRSGEIIADQLSKIGLHLEVQPVEWAQWLSEVFRGRQFDLSIVSHTEPNDMEIYARTDYYFGYDSDDFRSLLDELSRASSPKKIRKLRQRAQRYLHEDLPAIFLFQLPKNMVRVRNLEGLWQNSPIQANDFTQVRFTP